MLKTPLQYILLSDIIKLMRLELDEYEKDTLLETINYRIEEDEHLLVNGSLKSDLKDLLEKIQEDEYV